MSRRSNPNELTLGRKPSPSQTGTVSTGSVSTGSVSTGLQQLPTKLLHFQFSSAPVRLRRQSKDRYLRAFKSTFRKRSGNQKTQSTKKHVSGDLNPQRGQRNHWKKSTTKVVGGGGIASTWTTRAAGVRPHRGDGVGGGRWAVWEWGRRAMARSPTHTHVAGPCRGMAETHPEANNFCSPTVSDFALKGIN